MDRASLFLCMASLMPFYFFGGLESAECGVNVMLFGAKGNGEADDGPAIQRAIDHAANQTKENQQRKMTVFLPRGTYRIKQSLRLDPRHKSLCIAGEGIWGENGGIDPPTKVIWGGDDSMGMVIANGVKGIKISDVAFDGDHKAGKIISVNSAGGSVSAQWFVERVSFMNAQEGFVCGDNSDICNSDMTFYDLLFRDLDIGFHSYGDQALNYHFTRPQIGKCRIGMYFEKGGSVYASMVSGWGTGTVIKIGQGGTNAGTFNFPSMRMESYKVNGKRQVILETTGGVTNVKFDSLLTTCLSLWGSEADFDTPNFILGPGTQVLVDSSIISGKVASISGSGSGPTILKFNGCSFIHSSDPRDVSVDRFSNLSISDSVYQIKGQSPQFIRSFNSPVEFGVRK